MPRLTVVVTDVAGRARRNQDLVRWLPSAAPARAAGDVSIALVDDRAIRRLNREFRGIDRVTDVLSFPSGPQPALRQQLGALRARSRSAGRRQPHLGDIAIALGCARRQAREHGHSLETELRVLALHGLLHLLGYDHEADEGQMQRVEERLRRRAGLPSGLIGRAPTGRRSERATAREPRERSGARGPRARACQGVRGTKSPDEG